MKMNKIALFSLIGFVLVGCDSRIDAVNQESQIFVINHLRQLSQHQILLRQKPSVYPAHQLTAALSCQVHLAAELKIMAGKRVYPNFNSSNSL